MSPVKYTSISQQHDKNFVRKKQHHPLVKSDDVAQASLFVLKAWWARLYFWPFFLAYAFYALLVSYHYYFVSFTPDNIDDKQKFSGLWWNWLNAYVQTHYELYSVPLLLLAVVHFLTAMSCFWSVKWRAWITCSRVNAVEEAELVLVEPHEHHGTPALVPLQHASLAEEDAGSLEFTGDLNVHFTFQAVKFTWQQDCFVEPSYPDSLPHTYYLKHEQGIPNTHLLAKLTAKFGFNRFTIEKPTFTTIFAEHAVAPFFVFQMVCVGLWCLDEYWYYSLFTLVMLVVFESTVVMQRLRNIDEFRQMSIEPTLVYAFRPMPENQNTGKDTVTGENINNNGGKGWVKITSDQLIPGDLVTWDFTGDSEWTVPADLLLLPPSSNDCNGSSESSPLNVIVNEAMISGESTPLLKEPLTLEGKLSAQEHLNLSDMTDRTHVLFAGTKILQINAFSTTSSNNGSASSGGCAVGCGARAYVLRTGFGTLQGRLVRTMIFSSEQVSANNSEAFGFIGILLVFAILASGYVLVDGLNKINNPVPGEKRTMYGLLLKCILIITAVVPPELPMELTVAVNTALQALQGFAIFCMEPFRIPLAGKLDICAFDKTGTLTSENLDCEGLAADAQAGITNSVTACDKHAQMVAATCHSLFKVGGGVAGDPMERVTLEWAQGTMLSSDIIVLNTTDGPNGVQYRIVHRYAFNSALKRMSCLVSNTQSNDFYVTAKGAPEIMRSLFDKVPTWYDEVFLKLAHDGARVLALGWRTSNNSKNKNSKSPAYPDRSEVERGLLFAGFLVFRCPLKRDSRAAIKQLKDSQHRCVMITGDNPLTAIYTARQLDMIQRPVALIELNAENKSIVQVTHVSQDTNPDSNALTLNASLTATHDLAIVGDALEWLSQHGTDGELFSVLLKKCAVFARANPAQKELVVKSWKAMGLCTLMCGDGTNDVGALKQAHVGVALLDGKPEDLPKILREMRLAAVRKAREALSKLTKSTSSDPAAQPSSSFSEALKQVQQQQEAEDSVRVKLGDASVAAPFTSKVGSVHAVCTIIRQGRCSLVTTVQMYKILALNSLISAYSLSVLNLKGVRYGDFQMTITGLLLSGCFLSITRGQAVKKMSPSKPQSNIFNPYVMTSVFVQAALHIAVIVYVMYASEGYTCAGPTVTTTPIEIIEDATAVKSDDDDASKFTPNLVNTAIFLLSLMTQMCTFAVNYQGRPFRESLVENKTLRTSLALLLGVCLLAASQWSPSFNAWLELVEMPRGFQLRLATAMLVDAGGCWAVERLAYWAFFDAKPRLSITHE